MIDNKLHVDFSVADVVKPVTGDIAAPAGFARFTGCPGNFFASHAKRNRPDPDARTDNPAPRRSGRSFISAGFFALGGCLTICGCFTLNGSFCIRFIRCCLTVGGSGRPADGDFTRGLYYRGVE